MIGRQREKEIILDCAQADRSRLIVVYGRRRVGKTFLVREAFDYTFTFTHTGIEDGTYDEQLSGFWRSIRQQLDDNCPRPGNWAEAFDLLGRALAASKDRRKAVFIDELPWMDTRNSGFVKAISSFWNGWANARKDVVMVVCGSAAAWMTRKILQNRGGLFNRANRTIYLEPFTLNECEQFLESEGIVMNRRDIVCAYMIFGGAPYYWSLLDRRESLSQNIDRLFFSPNAELAGEFKRLYKSVFNNPEPYIDIVTALATKKIGMTRDELLKSIPDAGSNGAFSENLANLETSGFIRRYVETGNVKKGSVFQLIDNYTLFYFKFIRNFGGRDANRWSHLANDQSRVVWEGLAFERVCLQHAMQIKKALGVSGVATNESSWRSVAKSSDGKGAQIDLVIERGDRVTNLCEMKFSSDEYAIGSDEAERLRGKVAAFRRETGTRNACHLTFVTTYGLLRNKNSCLVQSQVTMDDLFAAL